MKKQKTSLVLEGGGMRGAYTAGALSWLIDNDVEFDNAYAISTGAVHLTNYLTKNKKNLLEFSTQYITDKNAIGIRAIIRCGYLIDYDYLFDYLMCKIHKFDIYSLSKVKTNAMVGVYELTTGKTEYHPVQGLDIEELKATCSLPLLGKVAKLGNRQMLDGGITDMIPIGQSLKDGCDKHLIITTKPAGYVRKPSSKLVCLIMKLRYRNCPSIAKDYAIRHNNYYKQIEEIQKAQNENKALYICPSKHSNVSRLGGSTKELRELFELGRNDMEARKDEILALFKK